IRSSSKNMRKGTTTSAKKRALRPNSQQQHQQQQQQHQQQMMFHQQQQQRTGNMTSPAGNHAQGLRPHPALQFTTAGMQNINTTAFPSAQQMVPNYGMPASGSDMALFAADSSMPP